MGSPDYFHPCANLFFEQALYCNKIIIIKIIILFNSKFG